VGCGNGGSAGEPGNQGQAGPAGPGAAAPSLTANVTQVACDPHLEQSFLEATLQEPPGDEPRPPDLTRTGKSVGKLYETVVGDQGKGGLWEQVKFVSPTGKRLHYSATITTSAGTMEMELWPEIAPNHVRNFVALARAGYYDGLAFDRAVEQHLAMAPEEYVQYVEAGCPLGSSDAGSGSIGYWMKCEPNDKVGHEVGTVGAWHDPEEVDSAGCKFYITLNRAHWLDKEYTIFGKITQGLEVVHKIHESPKAKGRSGQENSEGRLEHPVTIERVTIHAEEH
jgi:cyclophilin family peptidyl-prolyl cis-trans isomerase